MNWTFLLTLYGTPPETPNALLHHLGASAATCLVGSNTETLGYRLYEGGVPALMSTMIARPFSYFVFGDAVPEEMAVVNKGTTLFSYFNGALANAPSRRVLTSMLNLSSSGTPDANYGKLIHNRVMRGLHGKYSMLLAQLGAQPTFVFASQKLEYSAWLLSYENVYYMLASNSNVVANELEAAVLENRGASAETYYQQILDLPAESTMLLRPVYAITKFRQRIKAYADKNSRKLLIANYFRLYCKRQCVTTPQEGRA